MSDKDRPGRSITKPSRAEEALTGSEERFRHVAEISHEWIWEIDPHGYYTYSSPAVKDILGYKPAEVVGRHWLHFIAPEEKEVRRTRGQEVAARKEIFLRSSIRKTHKDGHTVVVASTGGPILDAEGHRLGYRGVDEDITERKQAEEALEKANAELESRVEERTAELAAANEQLEHDISERKQMGEALTAKTEEYIDSTNLTGDIIAKLDTRGRWAFLNDAACQFFGRPKEELLGTDARVFPHPEDLERTIQAIEEARAREEPIRGFVNRQVTPMGTRVVEWNASPFFDEEGQYAGIQMTGRDITAHKQMEEALEESEEQYRAIFEQAADSIVLIDAETGVVLQFNNRAHQALGYTREEFEKLKIPDFEVIESPEEVAKHIEKIIKEGTDTFETRHRTKSGEIRNIEVRTRAISTRGRNFIQAVFHDITERKRAEKVLRESEERLRSLVTNVPVVLFAIDREGTFTLSEGKSLDGLGLRPGGVVGRSVFEVYRDTPQIGENIHRALAGEALTATVEVAGLAFETHYTPVRDHDGEVSSVIGVAIDVTNREQAQEALRESEEKYRRLVQDSADGIVIFEGVEVRFVNQALLRMYGVESGEEIVGRPFVDFVSPEHRELMVGRAHARQKGENPPSRYEFKALRKDGTEVDAEISVSTITYQGRPAVQGIVRDITDRKRMEETLRESEARYRLLAENTSDLIWTMDLGLRYTYMSPSITRMRGYTAEEVLGARVTETMTPASVEAARKTLAEELAIERMEQKDLHRSRKLELEMYCKDGSTIWTEMNMTFLRDSDGKPVGILGVTRDISERKRAEEERERLHAELELRAITDSLTDLYDHAHFYRRLAEEIDRSKRYNHGFVVVMLDIDDFKRFNDSRGHQAGDEMLRLIAHCIQTGLRRSDIAFRYGGDEFAAILPHADSSKARAAVDRINARITKRIKHMDDGAGVRLSLSAGVACFPDDGTDADDLVRLADAALYSAKWVARARDIMGQREDIESLISALVSRRAGVEGPPGGVIFQPEALHEQQARIVSSVASSIAVALKDAGVAQALEDPDLQVLATVGAAAEIKDRYIRGHPERTSEQGAALAEEMGLSPQRVRDIRIAGLLHDIGKVTVSEGILNKPGRLTRREFASIKDHPIVGATLVSQVRGFERLVPIVRHHHERFDGKGYPDGLAGEEIPPEARVLSVVDVFDALTHQRSYRKALSRQEAIAEIERGAGTQFDPLVVKAFLALVKRRGARLAAPAQAASAERQPVAARAAARGKR